MQASILFWVKHESTEGAPEVFQSSPSGMLQRKVKSAIHKRSTLATTTVPTALKRQAEIAARCERHATIALPPSSRSASPLRHQKKGVLRPTRASHTRREAGRGLECLPDGTCDESHPCTVGIRANRAPLNMLAATGLNRTHAAAPGLLGAGAAPGGQEC